jgi:iron complex outermembrane receptor protein
MKKLRNEMKHSVFFLPILVIAMMFVTPVFGHEPGSVETEEEQSRVYMKIGTVIVSEKVGYLTTADSPGSVDVIGTEQLENENVDFSMQVLKKLPGVYYEDWNQGVIHGTIGIRGFDPNVDTSVALYVDGIPNNLSSGWMDLRPFFPFELERIELVKGTFDPRYGLNNIAGNVNVFTKRGGNYTQVRLLHGSFQTSEGNTVVAREKDGFSQTYFVGYRRTDGYRDHSDVRKGAVSGKWFYTSDDDRLNVGVIARFFDMDANAPGYLTKDQFKNDPQQKQEFSRTDGGVQENRQISLHLDYDFTDKLHFAFKTYTQDLERSRWVRFSEAGSQQERFTDERQSGAISTLTYETADWGIENLKLTWGMDYQNQDSIYRRYTTVDRVRQPGGLFRDWDYDQWFWGTYIQADGKVNKWLRLTGALRVDDFDGDLEDKNKTVDPKSDMIDYGNIWQPKVGMVVTPVQGYNLFANWGRAFQIGAWNKRFGDEDLDYSKNDGWEAGIKVSPVNWLAARLSYWEQNASDEIRNNAEGEPENIGETDRDGWDIGLSVRPHEWVTVWGAYSKTDAVYTNPGPGNEAIKGNDIKNIPDYTSKLGLDFGHPIGFSSSLWWESQGDYPVDAENTLSREGDYDVVNLDLRYDFKAVTLGFHIRNLFDEEYNGFVWRQTWGTPETWFSPGDERSFYASVTFEF